MRASSVSLGAGVTGPSAWLPLDHMTDAEQDGLYLRMASTGTVTLEVTPDDVFNPAVTPLAFPLGAPFAAATTNAAGALPFAATAVRMNAAANATGLTLTALVRGSQ